MSEEKMQISYLLPPSVKVAPWLSDPYEIRIPQFLRDFEEIGKADVAILGVPFDGAVVTGRPGARLGPRAIREILVQNTTYNPDIDIDLAEHLVVVDAGDVDTLNTDVIETHNRIELVAKEILRIGPMLVTIGGDHSITYPLVKALGEIVKGRVGVIMFDAHYDVRISHHGQISCGVPFRYILEKIKNNKVLGKNMVEIGIRSFGNSSFYKRYIEEKGIHVYTARMVHKRGIENILKEALEFAKDGTEAIYVSIDADGLDQTIAPGTNVPTIGGILGHEILEAAFTLGKEPMVRCLDFVEVSPPLDVMNLTANTAACVILEFIGGVAARKKYHHK
jgi:formimidoylglutamase